jgi:hypothetical protein
MVYLFGHGAARVGGEDINALLFAGINAGKCFFPAAQLGILNAEVFKTGIELGTRRKVEEYHRQYRDPGQRSSPPFVGDGRDPERAVFARDFLNIKTGGG